mgnify:FL=1
MARGFITKIPQPPGNIVGTVNDAYVPPAPSKLHGSYHWTSERAVAIGLVPLTLIPILSGSTNAIDATLAGLLLYHCHAGWEACITDYVQKRYYGKWHDAAKGLLLFGTAVAGYGVYEIETKEEKGFSTILSKLWEA